MTRPDFTFRAPAGTKTPSLNDYVSANRGNRYTGASFEKKWVGMAVSQIHEQKTRKHSKPVEITFHYFERDRRRDLDNIEYVRKPILDALVRTGVLHNDNQKYVVGFGKPVFDVDAKDPRVEVFIKEVV